MPRELRKSPDGGWHHVTNRGARRYQTFLDDRDRQTFLRILRDGARRFGTEVVALCLMGNHYHLILSCPAGGLSETMQHLGANYTRAFNHYHGYDGALFKARFHSELIADDEYLLQATRYVHRNPLELRLDIADYRWSTYGMYLGLRPTPTWIRSQLPLALAGGTSAYRVFVQRDTDTDKVSHAAGRGKLRPQPAPTGIVDLEVVDRAVAAALGSSVDEIRKSARGRSNPTRLAAVLLASQTTELPAGRIAGHYGLTSAASIRKLTARAQQKAAADKALAAVIRTARRELEAVTGVRHL